jgi:tetratricopeptide (TPR) repeat protein
MEHADVHAVVSLDSVMLFKDATTEAWKRLPFFDLASIRVPVLHLIRRAWVAQEDPAIWDQMKYAERTSMVFEDPRLEHLDFQSIGYALTRTGLRREAEPAVAIAFPIWNRYTLAFFDAHLKGDLPARDFLSRSPAQNGAPSGFVTLARRPAEPAPFKLADLLNAVDDGDLASVERAFRRRAEKNAPLPVPEDVLNTAGYNLLFSGRASEAVRLLTLNTETFPNSPNAWDSLADAYFAVGDRGRARQLSLKARALLDTAPGLDPQRKERIRQSIDERLKRLERPAS